MFLNMCWVASLMPSDSVIHCEKQAEAEAEALAEAEAEAEAETDRQVGTVGSTNGRERQGKARQEQKKNIMDIYRSFFFNSSSQTT